MLSSRGFWVVGRILVFAGAEGVGEEPTVAVEEGSTLPESMDGLVNWTARAIERSSQITAVMGPFAGKGVVECLQAARHGASRHIYHGEWCYGCSELADQCDCKEVVDEGPIEREEAAALGITPEDRAGVLDALKEIHTEKVLTREQVLGAQRLEVALLLEAADAEKEAEKEAKKGTSPREEYRDRGTLLTRVRKVIFRTERELMEQKLPPHLYSGYTGLRVVFTEPMKAFLGGEDGTLLCVGVNSAGEPSGYMFTMCDGPHCSTAEAPFDVNPSLVQPLLDHIKGLPVCSHCHAHIPPGHGVKCSGCACVVHNSPGCRSEEQESPQEEKLEGWICPQCCD